MRLLLENGAIWNDLDHEGMTPGCYAHKFGLAELYEVMVDAGVRAELLLGRLGGWVRLGDGDGDGDGDEDGDEEEGEEEERGEERERGRGRGDGQATKVEKDENKEEDEKRLAQNYTTGEGSPEWSDLTAVTSPEYLSSRLTYQEDRLVDSSSNGVMMAWETDIMKQTAALLLSPFSGATNANTSTTANSTTSITPPPQGPRILNIGFGMGIIDSLFRSHGPPPSKHTIIEAHTDVLCTHLHATSTWAKDPTIEIIPKLWQDALPELISPADGGPPRTYDIIYFDTFAEPYSSLRDFFTEYVPLLLDPLRGRFSFFNGLGADRKISYDVYRKVAELDLFEAGLETEWSVVKVPDLVACGEWEGIRRRYWCLDEYWLPVCRIEEAK